MTTKVDPAPHLRRTAGWTAALAVLWAAIGSVVWGYPMGVGVICGATLGLANIWLLARALATVVSQAEDHRPRGKRKWALPLALLVKWPLLILAFFGVLLYLPARPEGVAFGVVLSLGAAAIAALRGRTTPSG